MSEPRPDMERLVDAIRAFEAPATAYRPVITWIWNGRLDARRLCEQLDDIAAHGFGGVVFCPMGENFRLKDFLIGIDPPYLSEGFFETVRACVEHCARIGLYFWLYDEGGWPSGSAQGHVVAGHPEFRARVLTCRREEAGQPGEPVAPVARCAIRADGQVTLLLAGESSQDARHVLVFEEKVLDTIYPDLLNPAVVQRFIELTHERYARVVGDYFGTTIPGIFTDECRVLGRLGGEGAPWSPALAQRLDETHPDWRLLLPCLFGAEALGFDPWEVLGEAAVARARCAWADAVSRQFKAAYFDQINRWCDEHGLIHIGHVGGEDNLPDHVDGGFWHWFRTAGALHAPGVDIIWRQAFPGQANFSFPALAASALHGRPDGAAPTTDPLDKLAVSESYAVYGYGATFSQYAWAANFQVVRGVNRIWPVGYHYETAGGRAYGTMSHLGPGNPLWRHWPAFNLYLSRLGLLMSQTGHACTVAVYYPIEAEWAYHGRPEASRAWHSWRSICEALQEEQVPFDILDADAVASAAVGDACLETPGQSYGTVIVPECRVIPAAVMAKLAALHEAGGRVVFLGEEMPALATQAADQSLLDEAAESLRAVAFTLNWRSECEEWAIAGAPAMAGMPVSVLDGATAQWMLVGRRFETFDPRAVRAGAVVLAPEEEWWRVARLMVFTAGRYVLAPHGLVPDLRLASRWLTEDTWVHLLFNEGMQGLTCRLEVTSEDPLIVQRWDPLSGQRWMVGQHSGGPDPLRLPLTLAPGELTVLVTGAPGDAARPPDETVAPRIGKSRPRPVLTVERPHQMAIVERCHLRDGAMVQQFVDEPLEPSAFGRWTELGLTNFSGTVRYVLKVPLRAQQAEEELWLHLGRVEYAAA
ncbi:MAG: hypothetical protein N2512_03365, partial [Armatimonadetes bacterium]|nr:hypothetical protein [Armatimonadota bacterium]